MTEFQKREIAVALPTGTNTLGSVKVTDGTNLLPTMDAAARKGFVQITDGTNDAEVLNGSLQVVIRDPVTNNEADVITLGTDAQANTLDGLLTYTRCFAFNGSNWDRFRTLSARDTAGKTLAVGMTYAFSNMTGDTQVKGSAGVLHTVTINSCGTAGTLTIYDNTAESGTVIAAIAVIADVAPVTLTYDVVCATGIYFGYDATLVADITASYV